jgi:NADPH-dependent 2,4-dienoyl-CoA reductase/sulfur reductase-like enzyme/rubredoxin
MTYTADVGLKGVKIRRGLRVLDAFDVYLGGGLGTEVQMGTLYQKGVPVGELPELVEGLVRDFHLHRGEGETFSAYWRNKLIGHKPAPLSVDRPRWRCTRCDHLHVGEDPPPFCPICAALRARFEPEPEPDELPPVMAAVTAESLRAAAAAEAGAGSEPAPWVCASCGLKDFGAEPPELCPVCGAAKTSFQRPERRADAGRAATVRRPSGRRILVVGGSAAGHAAARAARATDPEAHITLVSDEAFYNRLNLTRYLSREVERDQLFDYGPDWYADEQIEVLTGMRVIGLDPIQKGVLLAEGRELPYDACVLAHGSSANVPVFHREALPGSFLLRTLADAEGILARVRPGGRAVVVGGGVLGLEAAHGLKTRGASVQVLESSPHLMPCQLDRAAAKLFLDMVAEKGIEAQSGVTVEAILGADQVEGITLADGRRIETDLVVVSTGIRPNVDWVKRSGIRCDRGVVVDDRLQTSAPDVYAAGDVAEWRQQVVGLWTNAIEQAKVAGINAAGGTALFHGFLPVTVLKCLGIDLVSIGEVSEDGGTITSSVVEGPGTYRKVVFRGGIPVGGVLLGTSTGMSELRRLVEGGRELETLRRQVVPDEVVADA